MKFSHIIATLALCLSVAVPAKTAISPTPVAPKTAPMPEWLNLGVSDIGEYDVQSSSIKWARQPLAVEFTLRTKFPAPGPGNSYLAFTLERTLILCNEDMVLVLSQKQVKPDGRSRVFNETVIYLNNDIEDSLTTRLVHMFCGAKPESMKDPSTPPTATPLRAKKKISV